MKSNEELENEIEDLRKELYFLAQQSSQGGTGGETGGNQSGGGGSSDDEGWQLLYDYSSEDANLNLGETTGLHSQHGRVTQFPDLVNFNKLRFLFFTSNSEQYYEFDISSKQKNGLRFMLNSASLNTIFGVEMTVLYDDDGKFILDIGKITQLYIFSSGNYPRLTTEANTGGSVFRKIWAK